MNADNRHNEEQGAPAVSDRPPLVTVYSKPDCHLCVEAMSVLRGLQSELGFEIHERDITTDEALHRAYFERIPVVALDGEELFDYVVDEQGMRKRLESRA
jgi:glutaredoxin